MSAVTVILNRAQQGDPRAGEELLPLVYEELRKLAAHKMAHEAAGHTLQPTALVHEAWLRLAGDAGPTYFDNRGHFFAAAAEAMRRILIDSARRKESHKRGADLERVNLEDVDVAAKADDTDAVADGRGARKARPRRPAVGGTGQAALLRRNDDRTGCGSARHLGAHCPALLGLRAGLAA